MGHFSYQNILSKHPFLSVNLQGEKESESVLCSLFQFLAEPFLGVER